MPSMHAARAEQFRQAKRIHGGLVGLCVATLGVKLARIPIPSKLLRERLYRVIFGQKYRALDERELERPLGDFRSFQELFTRGVRPELRPIADDARSLTCPCDSVVQDLGVLQADRLLTVKGISYTLSDLAPQVDVDSFASGAYAIFFLSPADCHRVFAPAAGAITELIHIPGRRLLVHPPYQREEFPVFSLNERVVMRLATPHGELLLILVAGWGVGNITLPSGLPIPRRRGRIARTPLANPLPVDRGQWMATFEIGSTVILLAPNHWRLRPVIERDQAVQYGQPAFTLLDGDRAA